MDQELYTTEINLKSDLLSDFGIDARDNLINSTINENEDLLSTTNKYHASSTTNDLNNDNFIMALNDNIKTTPVIQRSFMTGNYPTMNEQVQNNSEGPRLFEFNSPLLIQPILQSDSLFNIHKLDEKTTIFHNYLTSSSQTETDKGTRLANGFTCGNKSSPNGTPQREIYSDRFIPFRHESVAKRLFEMPEENNSTEIEEGFNEKDCSSTTKYKRLLEDKVLGVKSSCFNLENGLGNIGPHNMLMSKSNYILNKIVTPIVDVDDKSIFDHTELPCKPKLLKFKHYNGSLKSFDTVSNSSLSSGILPFTLDSFHNNISKITRKIPDKPFKILEAPNLEDDFYLNLIDWSSTNILGVALQSAVYLWSPSTSMVEKLCQSKNPSNLYTSISWDPRGGLLGLGNNAGKVEIWDGIKMKLLRDDMEAHGNRVGCISWSHNGLMVTGSRDKNIIMRDLRVKSQESTIHKYIGHKQEVCGLKWSPNDKQIASGGNDNKLFIWSIHKPTYEAKFSDHTSAVKALAWSPHQNGLLVSGGGSNDKSIKFWNTLTYKCIKSKSTNSQVCNLIFSKNSNEFVSTHGFSSHQIIIWKYPELSQVSVLEGHNTRVLYLTMSPDGETIVTGAGDETLRFWNAFPPRNFCLNSPLLPSALDLR